MIQGAPDDPHGDRFFNRAVMNPRVTPQVTWTIPWRRAQLGGMNGHGNARGIATAQSVLAASGAHGVRLLSEAGRERVMEVQADGIDLVMGLPLRWGPGYCVGPHEGGLDFGPRTAFWAGNGGSMSFVDLDHRMSFGYAPNRWIRGTHETERSTLLLQAVYESLAATGRTAA